MNNKFKNIFKITFFSGIILGTTVFLNTSYNEKKEAITKETSNLSQSEVYKVSSSKLTSIVIPELVKELNSNIFSENVKLADITLPEGLTTIHDNALSNLSSLKKIIIPSTVTSIGVNSFANTSSLMDITISSSFKGDDTPKYGFTQVQWDAIQWVYSPSDANYITKNVIVSVGLDTKEVITLADWETYLPNAQTMSGSFYNNEIIKSIEIPAHIQWMGDNVFNSAINLENIIFSPDSIMTHLGRASIANTKITNLVLPDTIFDIRARAFSFNAHLVSIVLPPHTASIQNQLLEGCLNIEEIIIPESVISIGDSAFSGITKLKKIFIPKGVVSIGDNAFLNTTALNDIEMDIKFKTTILNYGLTQEQWDSIKWNSSLSLTNDVVVSLGWDKKTKITLNDWRGVDPNITTIHSAFIDNKILTHIEIPNYILDIGINSFQNATSLESVMFESGSKLENIGYQAFFGTNLKSIYIPLSVISISINSFSNNLNLNNISMGFKFKEDVENFGFTKTQWDSINWVNLPTDENILTMEIALSLGWDKKTEITLNDWEDMAPNITAINSAFLDNKILTYIEIPNSILNIELNAFKNATTLSEITFEKDSKLQFIKEEAFFNSSLESIDIPDSVISIADSAFKNTDLLKNIKISNKLKTDTNHFGFNDSQWNSIVWSSGSLNMKFIIIVASLGFIMIIQAFVMGYSAIQIKKIDV